MLTRITRIILLSVIAAHATAVEVGEAAPAFSLKVLGQDDTVDLASMRGKTIYLDFWASWCATCIQSMPHYAAWARQLDPENAVFLAISIDRKPRKALRYLEQNPVPFISLSDPDNRVARDYDVRGTPTAFIIDRSGKVAHRHQGFEPDELESIQRQFTDVIDDYHGQDSYHGE